MNLNISTWKDYRLGDLFEIKKGKRLTLEEQTDGLTPYIGAIDSNNGVSNYIGQTAIHEGNTISLSYNGSVGEAFYQPVPFWATDDVNVLYFRNKSASFNRYIAMFICTILKQEKYRYCYGRKWVLDSMLDTLIKLPTNNNTPDWQFMEDYIKSLYCKEITTSVKGNDTYQIKLADWRYFKISNLFDVYLSKGDIKLDDVCIGTIPLISSGEDNNGVVGMIDKFGDGKADIFNGNVLSIDMFNNVFYQPKSFYAVSHGRVNILSPKFPLNKYIGLFIATIIKREKFKFSYGRAVYSSVAMDIKIKLPCKKNGKTFLIDKAKIFSDEGYIPDWEYMENYIKSLPFSDRI
ncbi:MAG: restriction endonuclease subunit S [Roseburia sp.]|nr:restriction endonuclease subunit S [Roseburia sp.]